MLEQYSHTKSELLTEKQKSNKDYLTQQIDLAIAELVYDKDHLRKAYNYYNGERDKDQYKHLEDNFGIGTATSVEFIPLIRGHIDVLIGEQLMNELKPTVTCKDSETLSKINEEKKMAIYKAELALLKKQLNENLNFAGTPQDQQGQAPEDTASERLLTKLKEDAERDFISEFEISAHYVLKNLSQNKRIDLYNKLKILFLDLLVAGQCYYKVNLRRKGEAPEIEVYNPFDVFVDKDPNSPYVKTSRRGVVRKWYTKQQIVSKYGMHMSNEDLENLDTQLGHIETNDVYYIRSNSGGLVANTSVGVGDVQRHNDSYYRNVTLVPVYEVEWLTNNEVKIKGEKDYRLDRYSGVRIGENIYLDMGPDDDVVRSSGDPLNCALKLNGMTFDERGTKPYSLVLMTANLQDKYDVLHFYRDQLIASSGVKGDFLDVAQLPKFLGTNEAERIAKYITYKKSGIALLDTSQEGSAQHNTVFSGFDDTVSGEAIQAIQFAIQSTAETVSAITGVFRERLGGIEQKDAVTNVQVGIKQSAIITKQYFQMMDSVTNELLIDAVNICKISYAKGTVGSVILGNKMQKIFTIDPKNFCFTDYDIHIAKAGENLKDIETIRAVTTELIKAGTVDIDIMLEALTSESLTEMKENVSKSYRKKMEENSQLNQATQQLEQLQQQLKQMQQELQKAGIQNEQLKQKVDQFKEKELSMRYEIDKDKNRITEENNEANQEINKERTALEKLQLLDNNPHNNKVNFAKK